MLWVTHCLLFLSHAASAVAVRGKAKTSTALPVSISNRTVKATQRCESRFLRECRPDDVAPRGHESHVVVPRWSHQVSVWGCGRAVVALGWHWGGVLYYRCTLRLRAVWQQITGADFTLCPSYCQPCWSPRLVAQASAAVWLHLINKAFLCVYKLLYRNIKVSFLFFFLILPGCLRSINLSRDSGVI